MHGAKGFVVLNKDSARFFEYYKALGPVQRSVPKLLLLACTSARVPAGAGQLRLIFLWKRVHYRE